MDSLRIEGEPDPKPFKLWRINDQGERLSLEGEFGSREEVDAFKRRLDYRYELWHGRRKLS
jgi:hypothetical protein